MWDDLKNWCRTSVNYLSNKEELTWPHFWSTKKDSQHNEDYGLILVLVLNESSQTIISKLASLHFWVKTLPEGMWKPHYIIEIAPLQSPSPKWEHCHFALKSSVFALESNLVRSVSCVLLCSTSAVILISTQIRSKQFLLHVVCNFSCALLSYE